MQQNTHSKSDLKPDIFQSEHFFKICEEKALDYLTSPPSIVSHQNPCFDSTPQNSQSIPSMITPYISSPQPPEEKLLCKEDFLELWAEHSEQVKKDWAEIFSKNKNINI